MTNNTQASQQVPSDDQIKKALYKELQCEGWWPLYEVTEGNVINVVRAVLAAATPGQEAKRYRWLRDNWHGFEHFRTGKLYASLDELIDRELKSASVSEQKGEANG